MAISSPPDLFGEVVRAAAAESPLWGGMARPKPKRGERPVFSPLGPERLALGIETIYEGFLAHYGTPRLFAPPDPESALLLGDYLYAHGLVRIAELRDVAAVSDLAELISLSAQLRADGTTGEGELWAATAAAVGSGRLGPARAALRETGDAAALRALARETAGEAAVDGALAAHRLLLR